MDFQSNKNTIGRHFILDHLEKANVHKYIEDSNIDKDKSWNSISLLHFNVLQNIHQEAQNGIKSKRIHFLE
jgi:hypothetical protein